MCVSRQTHTHTYNADESCHRSLRLSLDMYD